MQVAVGPAEELVDEPLRCLRQHNRLTLVGERHAKRGHVVHLLLHGVRVHEPHAEVPLDIRDEVAERDALPTLGVPSEDGFAGVRTDRAGRVLPLAAEGVEPLARRFGRLPRAQGLILLHGAYERRDPDRLELLSPTRIDPHIQLHCLGSLHGSPPSKKGPSNWQPELAQS